MFNLVRFMIKFSRSELGQMVSDWDLMHKIVSWNPGKLGMNFSISRGGWNGRHHYNVFPDNCL